MRAYLKTVWLVTIGSRKLANEAAKQQDVDAARVFRRITAVVLSIALVGPFVAAVVVSSGHSFFAIQQSHYVMGQVKAWAVDVLVPWCAGATISGVLPVLLVFLSFLIVAAPGCAFRMPQQSRARHERASVIACYAIAPLNLLLLAAPLGAVQALLCSYDIPLASNIPVLVLGVLSLLAGTVGAILRLGQWITRVRRSGWEAALPWLLYLAGSWLFAVIALLGLLPWCVEFLWIVVNSFR